MRFAGIVGAKIFIDDQPSVLHHQNAVNSMVVPLQLVEQLVDPRRIHIKGLEVRSLPPVVQDLRLRIAPGLPTVRIGGWRQEQEEQQ